MFGLNLILQQQIAYGLRCPPSTHPPVSALSLYETQLKDKASDSQLDRPERAEVQPLIRTAVGRRVKQVAS